MKKSKLIATAAQTRMSALLHKNWQTKPITKPKVNPGLKKLTGVQRAAETCRFNLLSFEFWLSPFGRLREWVRLNSKISAVLLVPAVLVLPLVGWIIYQIAGWFSMLVGLATSLIFFPILMLIAIGVLAAVTLLLRSMLSK